MFSAENIIMGVGSIRQNQKESYKRNRRAEQQFGLNINLDKKIYQMSVSEKQTIEIMKVLSGNQVLILDEPLFAPRN